MTVAFCESCQVTYFLNAENVCPNCLRVVNVPVNEERCETETSLEPPPPIDNTLVEEAAWEDSTPLHSVEQAAPQRSIARIGLKVETFAIILMIATLLFSESDTPGLSIAVLLLVIPLFLCIFCAANISATNNRDAKVATILTFIMSSCATGYAASYSTAWVIVYSIWSVTCFANVFAVSFRPHSTTTKLTGDSISPWTFEFTEVPLSENEAVWRTLITVLTIAYSSFLIVMSMLSALVLLITEGKTQAVLIVFFVVITFLLTWLIVRANRLRNRDKKAIRLGYQENTDLHFDALSFAKLLTILGLLFASLAFIGGLMGTNWFAMLHGVIWLSFMAWGAERLLERNVR